jgi:protein TonB
VALSPLKFSLIVSVLVHGLAIGGAVWLGKFHRTTAIVEVGDVTTLELIAAPASAPERAIETLLKTPLPVSTPPPSPPIPLSAEEIVPVKTVSPLPVQEITSPIPTPVVPAVVVAVSAPPSVAVGDNSSPAPGNDFTTVAGNPTAQAKPDYRKNPEPEYPLAARRRGQQGTVLLSVTVNARGQATEIALKQSSGYELLDQAALQAVKAWEFEQARIGSLAMESKIEAPVRFKLSR